MSEARDECVVDRCVCVGITLREIVSLARREEIGFEEVRRREGCGAGCGLCAWYVRAAIASGRTAFPLMGEPALRAIVEGEEKRAEGGASIGSRVAARASTPGALPDGEATRGVRKEYPMRVLVAIPVYNEERYVESVIHRVLEHATDVLAIDDGSTDGSGCLLPKLPVCVIRHAKNRGYGRAMQHAFRWAMLDEYDWVITMDCDEQHEPAAIPRFLEAARAGGFDVVSGSRYLPGSEGRDAPPPERRAINTQITAEINDRLGLSLTDAFCGFKAYRVSTLSRLRLSEDGYAFPMQFWVQAVAQGLRIREIPVRLIYNDPSRTFGGPLDHAPTRLAHYQRVLHCEIEKCRDLLPVSARQGVRTGCGEG